MQVLLIENDRDCCGWLGERLAAANFVVCPFASEVEILAGRHCKSAAAIVIEFGQAGAGAASMVRRLRAGGVSLPVMVLTATGDWRERVASLDAGADEVLLKPVRSEEIAARLRAIIRRAAGSPINLISAGDIDLDLKARCAWLDGKCLDLTRNEFRLLRLFLLQSGRVLAREEIAAYLHADLSAFSPNAIEVLVARLRRKVGRERVRTIRGLGYRFVLHEAVGEGMAQRNESCPRTGDCEEGAILAPEWPERALARP